jgi:hypothetical protein
MTTRRAFIASGLAAAGFAITRGHAAATAKPAITVHRSPT